MSNSLKNKHESENEDDPEPFESSGDEWDVEEAKKQETGGRRKSARVTKKPKRPVVDESGSDDFDDDDEDDDFSEEDFFEETPKKKTPNKKSPTKPSAKKQKITHESDLSNDTNSNISQEEKRDNTASDSDSSRTSSTNTSSRGSKRYIPKTIFSEDFATGSFVILKKDAQAGESKHPVIWRIDGKALLQKYEAFDEEDKVYHRNTSIYTGWSPLDKDLYVPITVDVIKHNNSNLTVAVQWDKIKVLNVDSD